MSKEKDIRSPSVTAQQLTRLNLKPYQHLMSAHLHGCGSNFVDLSNHFTLRKLRALMQTSKSSTMFDALMPSNNKTSHLTKDFFFYWLDLCECLQMWGISRVRNSHYLKHLNLRFKHQASHWKPHGEFEHNNSCEDATGRWEIKFLPRVQWHGSAANRISRENITAEQVRFYHLDKKNDSKRTEVVKIEDKNDKKVSICLL